MFLAAKLIIIKAWKKLFVYFTKVKQCMDTFFVNEKLRSVLMDTHKKFLSVPIRNSL